MMKSFFTVLKRELNAKQLVTTLIVSALIALFMSLVILRGYQISSTQSMTKFIYSGLIILVSLTYTVLISFQRYDQLLNDPTYRINYLTTCISYCALYWGHKISTLFFAILSLFITILSFYITTSLSFSLVYCFYFCLFLVLSLVMVIAIVALIKYLLKQAKFIEYNIYFILFFLIIGSGFLFKTSLFPESVYRVLDYLPFGIIFNGARNLLLNDQFTLIEILYVSLLAITLVTLNYYLYKRELGK